MSITDFLFPKKCVGCKKTGTYFCTNCIKSSKPHFPQVCPICQKTSLDGLTHKKCKRKQHPDGLFVIWEYSKTPRKIITKLKYKYVSSLALSLATPAAGTLKNWQRSLPEAPNWTRDKFLLIPIPLHWTRKNWRGFNHSEEVAKILVELMGWQTKNLLRRWYTKPQVGLKGEERRKNVKGAFEINKNYCLPPNFARNQAPLHAYYAVLFDDVWTTGSTMCEAAKVLKQAGFKKVWCLTLAR